MIQDVIDRCLPFSPKRRVLKDRTAWLGVGFEHPNLLIPVDPDIKSDLADQMLLMGFNRFS